MRLTGKIALVTGASRGIGKAIALRLADEGCEVVVHFHENREEAEAVGTAIRQRGSVAHLLQADLLDSKQAIRLGQQAWDIAGRIDILVNNAGVSYKKHFLDVTEADFEQFNTVNFKSTTFLTQAIARNMVMHDLEGSIWTITSVNGIRPGLGLSLYGATKGALETLMKGVAMELAPHHIRVNTLAIGAIQTDINRAVWENPALLQDVNQGIPAGRLGQPDEIAAILVDLITSGSYMTGSTITIDGGLLLMRGYGKPGRYEDS
ncbi:SDR family NAD(P)-dependent oxidoreductase [Spirosoma endbachense]|uniref:SDR family oxidoreductase n=1 Tax=Spirosoma endbachense TaxID=2666025 RepID=A0A6P1VR12_9BACT|nr:SDR family oxidoreductase [Spirosoma endbachense]QHV94147.1 SDR family oxidoreductase [Spirosoma endbachense]